MKYLSNRSHPAATVQRGASLIMVLLILVVVSLLGVGSAQIALMSERGARNDRDLQVAWQAADAALVDAAFDIESSTTPARKAIFDGKSSDKFVVGCTGTGVSLGLCQKSPAALPAWLTVTFTTNDSTPFGQFTGRAFAAGGVGIQPAQAPRYIVELVPDPVRDLTKPPTWIYRVTAMGFGPRVDIQAVLQMIYRI